MDDISSTARDAETAVARKLASPIRPAHRDGIDVETHWACRSRGDSPDWDLAIVRVAPEAPINDEGLRDDTRWR